MRGGLSVALIARDIDELCGAVVKVARAVEPASIMIS
jgi:hypothetical protein